jgi:glycerol-3-phosphate dehydrogenase
MPGRKDPNLMLQGYKAPDGLRASSDMAEVVKHAELLLMVIPTPFVAATIKGIRDQLRPDQVCLSPSNMCLDSASTHFTESWI